MKYLFPSAVGVARWIERSVCAVRFHGKTGKGKTSTEAFASILAHPGEPILRNTGRAGARCRNCAISPQMNLHTLKNQESTSTRVESSTAVQHLTKALFLSKPVEPPLTADDASWICTVSCSLPYCVGAISFGDSLSLRQSRSSGEGLLVGFGYQSSDVE